MINFDNYCYNYFNNKFNITFIDSKLQSEFRILYNKITNSQLQFSNVTDQTFNKYLPNLIIETGRLFNKVKIFSDFEHSSSIKSKIIKTTHSIYNYYKTFNLNNQLLYTFYNNYSLTYHNIATITCYQPNEISICDLLLEELFINVFKDFLSNLKSQIAKASLNISLTAPLDNTLICNLITQNLIIQNTTVNNQLSLSVLNLLDSDLNLINTYVNSKLLLINKKTIGNLISDKLESYLLYNLITSINITKTSDINEQQKSIQNSLVNHYLQSNNNIIESFQFIAAQFKNDPLLFINFLKISHSYLVDMLSLNYQYDFTSLRDNINYVNINQVDFSILQNFVNNKNNYLPNLDIVIKHAIQNYLIKYIDSLLNDSYVTDIIINSILVKLTKYSVLVMTFKFQITNYIKLLYVNHILQLNFEEVVSDYITAINEYEFNTSLDQITGIMIKTQKSLYLDKLNQNDKLKNFYMSAVADSAANMIINRYRV